MSLNECLRAVALGFIIGGTLGIVVGVILILTGV